jgi:sugar O-acyltransferase (sialic acid O-acetyltransferase NeuD family)
MILYGASGHAKVIADILKANGIDITKLFDDNDQIKSLSGINVVKPYQTKEKLIISIGNNAIRKKIVETNNFRYGVAIHPTAIVSPSAVIGEGTVVMQGAIIQADAIIGKHCIINTGATVDHECKIEDYAHISPNSSLCGNVKVGEGSWIGAGTTIIPGIKIGSWSTIGAGSTVINNINSNMVAVGCPCKIIRNNMKINNLLGGGNANLYCCVNFIKTTIYAA